MKHPNQERKNLFGHLVITTVKELLALSQSLLQKHVKTVSFRNIYLEESRVTPSSPKPRPTSQTCSALNILNSESLLLDCC